MGPPIERWCQVSVEMGPPIEQRCQVSNPLIKRNPPKFINFRPAEVYIMYVCIQYMKSICIMKSRSLPNTFWESFHMSWGVRLNTSWTWYLKDFGRFREVMPSCLWLPCIIAGIPINEIRVGSWLVDSKASYGVSPVLDLVNFVTLRWLDLYL